MRTFTILFLTLSAVMFSCTKSNQTTVTIDRGDNSDTLFISEITTGKRLVRADPNMNVVTIEVDHLTIGTIESIGDGKNWMTILKPGSDKKVLIESNRVFTTDQADSILNYLWHSNNETIAQNSGQIFGDAMPNEVKDIFELLIKDRSEVIDQSSKLFDEEIRNLLHYQNKARAYAFLFFYGRILKGLDPKDSFFDFVDQIETENPFISTLPDVVLYKYEVEYLRTNDSIQSVNSFIQFIEEQTSSIEIENFLKIKYLQEVMESPSYWQKHLQIFDSHALKEALGREESNPFLSLIESSQSSFKATVKGEKAFNFNAITVDSTTVSLSDFYGKVVFIDVWATWCGPCISQRPNVINLARKFQENDEVAILMISIDPTSLKWKKYVERTNPDGFGNELFISGQFTSDFSKNYFISSIPRYILIDKKGRIISANVAEPSASLEAQIENLLNSSS
jgi:thiol-disulfide isomerase/thioredoxin